MLEGIRQMIARVLQWGVLFVLASPTNQGCANSVTPDASEWCTSASPCSRASYATSLPPTNVLYVNTCCGYHGSADGTIEYPYRDIGSALAEAEATTTIAVAAGKYDEEVVLASRVSILGAGCERTLVQSGTDQPTLQVTGVDGTADARTTIHGLSLRGSGGLGILVSSSQNVTLVGMNVANYGMALSWNGVGAYVVDSQDIEILETSFARNRAGGIVFSGSTGRIAGTSLVSNGMNCESAAIAAVEGSYLRIGADLTMHELGGSPGMAGKYDGGEILKSPGIGVYASASVVEVRSVVMAANDCGGILIDQALESDQGSSIVAGNLIAASNRFGVSVHDSQVSIMGNSISSVGLLSPDAYDYSGGDGILVSNRGDALLPSLVTENDVAGCRGTGILLDGVQEATVRSNHVFGSERGGIWLQNKVEAPEFEKNVVDAAWGAGIVVGAESQAHLEDNFVTRSSSAAFPIVGESAGSGVTVFTMAHGIVLSHVAKNAVTLKGNTVALCLAGAGLLASSCESDSILFQVGSGVTKPNLIAGNQHGIVAKGNSEAIHDLEGLQDPQAGDKVNFASDVYGPNLGQNVLDLEQEPDKDKGWLVADRQVLGPDELYVCIPPACTD